MKTPEPNKTPGSQKEPNMSKKNVDKLNKTTVSFDVVYGDNDQIRIANPIIEGKSMPLKLFCALMRGVVSVEDYYNLKVQLKEQNIKKQIKEYLFEEDLANNLIKTVKEQCLPFEVLLGENDEGLVGVTISYNHYDEELLCETINKLIVAI